MKRTRIALAALVGCIVLSLATPALAWTSRDDTLPGMPIAAGTIAGTVTPLSDPYDYFAVQVSKDQTVTISLANISPMWDCIVFHVLDRDTRQIMPERFVQARETSTLEFKPTSTGVYFVQLDAALNTACPYRLMVSGNVALPPTTTLWNTLVAPGYTLNPVYGTTTKIRGTVRPTFSARMTLWQIAGALQSRTATGWADASALWLVKGSVDATTPVIKGPSQFRFTWVGDGIYDGASSASVSVVPRVFVTAPTGGGSNTLTRNVSYNQYGFVNPRTSAAIRVDKYNSTKGWWAYYETLPTVVSSTRAGLGYMYTRKAAFPAGKYRLLVVTGKPSGCVANTSAYRYITVK